VLGHVFEVTRKEWGIYVHNPVRDINLPPGGRLRDRLPIRRACYVWPAWA
jgi:hypothetical protein